ncbi:thioesterase family protein [Chelativorans sp. SCAU2101]|mgnify:CR=1 FL=1|jgi:Predicted thioesterase|uniref:Thioesterase family protein n=1 Tax=Chelativorans petroleitrophicus TaxID=2975484 RepID=A0A9X2X7Z2_9HYPH|nr:thioesterase family protein [Chelativorans petroleitrophicus]MCT8989340.1 thioesterase family protein [Chelativorans petroleitrophicus]
MYVWFRLLRVAATRNRRGPFQIGGESRLSFRCLPTDVDMNLHLNNARYMMLADLGRMDIFFRCGLMRLARKRGWAPLLGGLQTAFVREIRLWQRFEIVSTIETWAGTNVIGRHRFLLDDGTTAAIILTTAGVYDFRNRGFLKMEEVMAEIGHTAPPPREPSEEERAFTAVHRDLRRIAKNGR